MIAGIDYLPDNYAEAIQALPAMARPCVECPYTPGTPASADSITRRLAAECAASRSAFLCHKTIDARALPTHLCAGWLEAVSSAPGGEQ